MIGVIFLGVTYFFYNLVKLNFTDDGIDKADTSFNGADAHTFYGSKLRVLAVKSDEQPQISFETFIPVFGVVRSHAFTQCHNKLVEIYKYLLVYIETIVISAYVQNRKFLTGLKLSAFQRGCACDQTIKLNRRWLLRIFVDWCQWFLINVFGHFAAATEMLPADIPVPTNTKIVLTLRNSLVG